MLIFVKSSKRRLNHHRTQPVKLLVFIALYTVQASLAQESSHAKASPDVSSEELNYASVKQRESTDDRSKESKLVEEMLIFGVKSNFISAQDIKRDASTMVDAVSAEDIGVLPDYSVLDAIQRLPGIALERFADVDDPDHFSTESSGITIRGLTQSRSEFNGRDTFTANQGRALSYQDVPPELMGSIEIYKNQTADMIEGGIGGTVVLRTRKPFDFQKRTFAFNLDGSYGDIAKQFSPAYSGLFSDTVSTSHGDVGFLVNYVDSTFYGESHGIQSATYLQHYAADLVTENNPGAIGTRAEDFLGEDDLGIVWAPNSSNLLMKEDERQRKGLAAVAQFKSTDGALSSTLEFIRSDSKLTWIEKAIKYNGGYYRLDSRKARPLDGTHFIFDENGLFQAGTITREQSWRSGPSGASRVPTPPEFPQWGHITVMDSRVNDLSSLVEDTSLLLEWEPNDRFKLIGDLQYVNAKTRNDDVSVHVATWLNVDYDTRGSTPNVTLISPWLDVRDVTRANDSEPDGLEDNIWDEQIDGVYSYPGFGGDPAGDQNYFQDPNSYFWRSAMDHYERSDGSSVALRMDGQYNFQTKGLLKSLSAGIRYAKRQQIVRATPWNWGALTPEWQSASVSRWTEKTPEELAQRITEAETDKGRPLTDWEKKRIEILGLGIGWLPEIPSQYDGVTYVDWSDFMGGGVAHVPGGQTIHASENLIRDVSGTNPRRYLLESTVQSGNWQPYPERDALDAKYGLFLPEDINTTTETRDALYLKLDFGSEEGLSYSGNIGLRYVTMTRRAEGEVVFPSLHPGNRGARYPVPDELTLPLTPEKVDAFFNQQVANGEYDSYYAAAVNITNVWVENPYYYLPDDVRGFGSVQTEDGYVSAVQVVDEKNRYETYLPSFNIKVDLNEDIVGRVAFAKALAFPDMGDVRNKTNFGTVNHVDLTVVERTVVDGERSVTLPASAHLPTDKDELLWVGEGGNPSMQPMESVQYDFSLEWYFSEAGQLSAAIFHKNLSRYFSPGVIYRDFTHPVTEVTQTTAITSKRNGGDAKLDGLELTYHHFYDGMLQGFGLQATYTFVDTNTIPNNVKDIQNEQWYNSIYEDTGIRVNYDKLPLEGQSDHTVNVVGMYERAQWSVHLSYNWRSKYLLTTRDVITKAPQWYDDHGELDGSVFYSLNDQFTLGLQAINMTNAQSKTLMILNDDLLSTGRSWFQSDRRIALVLRGSF